MTDRRKITGSQRNHFIEYVDRYCPECEECGNAIVPDDDWVIDHRVPWIALTTLPLHGAHWPYLIGDIVNMQPMHRLCNEDKGSTIKDADVKDLRNAWDDARMGQTHLFRRVRDLMIAEERRTRQAANLERQLHLFD